MNPVLTIEHWHDGKLVRTESIEFEHTPDNGVDTILLMKWDATENRWVDGETGGENDKNM